MKRFLFMPVLLLIANALIAQNAKIDTFTYGYRTYDMALDTAAANHFTIIYSIVPYDSNIKMSHLTAYSTFVWTNSIKIMDTTFVVADNIVYRTIMTFFTPLGGRAMRQAITDKFNGYSWDFESIEIKPIVEKFFKWSEARGWEPFNNSGITAYDNPKMGLVYSRDYPTPKAKKHKKHK